MKRISVLLAACCCVFFAGRSARAESAVCDGLWHYVSVSGAMCLDGTPTGLEYVCFDKNSNGQAFGPTPPINPKTKKPDPLRRPLMIFLNGGGACWDAASCNCQMQGGYCSGPTATIEASHYDITFGCDGQAYGQCQSPIGQTYFADLGEEATFNGPTSPFNNSTVNPDGSTGGVPWNMVYLPYCTGDTFRGDADPVYSSGTLTIHAHHHGYRNTSLYLKVLTSMFPEVNQVSFFGESAGGYGVVGNESQFASAFPNAKLSVLLDGYNPFDSVRTPTWAIWGQHIGAYQYGKDGSIVPLTSPISIPPGTPNVWSDLALFNYDRLNLPQIRTAWTDDYTDGPLGLFSCWIGAPQDASGTCALSFAASLNDAYGILGGGPTTRVFFHTGQCHSEREIDFNGAWDGSDPGCDYDNMIQTPGPNEVYSENCQAGPGQTCYRDWVRGWGQVPGFDWENVK
jgi:hypothetical protein